MSKVAIMITSCDAFKECWKPMIYSLDKYWPDCEFPRYIVSNFTEEALPNTTFIKVGDDKKSWCNLTKKAMELIDADYIIYFQEDYWLDKPVNNKAIKKHIEYFEINNLDYLKLELAIPRDDLRIGETDYCLNPPDKRYTINTAIAIWRKETMKKLMIENWTGWDYERLVIPYIINNNFVIKSQMLYSPLIPTKGFVQIPHTAIVRGVWSYAGVKFLKENNMENILNKRKVMGPLTHWLYSISPGPQSVWRYPVWGVLKILKRYKLNW